jgi:hypothetical protein
VTSWYESRLDRLIREAQERGEFDDLPGAGKPLPGRGEPDDEDWWIKAWVRREQITGVLPATMVLRKEVEDVLDTAAKKTSEQAVRAYVADLNGRIRRAQRGLLDGPPVALSTVDAEAVVRDWRARRA